MRTQEKALFVDRDGTINVDTGYLHEPERFELLPGAAEGLRKFQDMGYRIVVVTSQRGITLGYYPEEAMHAVHEEMVRQLAPFGVRIDKIYFSTATRSQEEGNPKEALLKRAEQEMHIDLKSSVVIGDKTTDLEAGINLGCTLVGVTTGKGLKDGVCEVVPAYIADSILDAADFIEAR